MAWRSFDCGKTGVYPFPGVMGKEERAQSSWVTRSRVFERGSKLRYLLFTSPGTVSWGQL